LQGYLLRNKTRPYEAVAEVAAWVESEQFCPTRSGDYRMSYTCFFFVASEEREAKAKLKKLKEEEAKKAEEEVSTRPLFTSLKVYLNILPFVESGPV
jgi:hypothetical protein